MQTEVVREKQFNMRLSASEWASVETLCEHYGMTAAELLRMLIQREVSAVGQGKKPLRLGERHVQALRVVAQLGPEPVDIGAMVNHLVAQGDDPKTLSWLRRALDDLRRSQHLVRQADGYVLTDRGQTAATSATR